MKKVIAVMSGKGGVGKSSVSVQLAVTLALAGKKVGLLDVDLCGPSIPKMLNVTTARIQQGNQGWLPVCVSDGPTSLLVMSIGFLLPDLDSAVLWRGPKKTAMIKQFLFNVEWGELDYLIIDTPPGTSDEHLAMVEFLPASCILVTTPQLVALADVEREVSFCAQVGLPMMGLIENMSGYLCPHCNECTNMFSAEGGRLLAEKHSIPFLGKVPIEPRLVQILESPHINILNEYPNTQLYEQFKQITNLLNLV